MCVLIGGGEGSGVTRGVHVGSKLIHTHKVHIPVQPLNYSFNVYQVLAVNSLYALFSSLVFTKHNHS